MFALAFASVSLSGCMGPIQWWSNVQHKARHLSEINFKYDALQKEHTELQRRYLELEHKYQSLENRLEVSRKETENLKFAGDKEGRHLANIENDSTHEKDVLSLPMKERVELAMEHSRADRFSEAFVLFESVLWSPEGAKFQTPLAFYQAGVSAYEIRNWKRAKDYFEAASAHAHSLKDRALLHRSDLWLKVLNQSESRMPASEQALPKDVKRTHGGGGAHH